MLMVQQIGRTKRETSFLELRLFSADAMVTGKVAVDEYDDHALHITEHTRFLLSAEIRKLGEKGEAMKKRYVEHIALHKKAMASVGEDKETGK